MTIPELQAWLLGSLAVNYGLLCLWFAAFAFGHDTLYHLHRRWFRLSVATFDAIHYAGMALFKIGIFLFNVAPLVALCLIR
ncbi:hypothetical protein JCM19379_04940 [Methyloparacoccus murrellii]|jgi:hypothetical protein